MRKLRLIKLKFLRWFRGWGPDDICTWCGCEVDRTVCHCGGTLNDHAYWDGHSFVSMGCICGYPKDESEDWSRPW